MKAYTVKTILVPTDFTSCANNALSLAISLAQKSKARLVLINVIKRPTVTSADGSFAELGFVSSQVLQSSKNQLQTIADKITSESGLRVECYTLQGFLYENIIRSIHLYAADIVVMGTAGFSEKSTFLGSNTYRIVKHAPVPVLTIRENIQHDSIVKIVFPVNDEGLSVQKVDEVAYFAKIFHAEVLTLGVMADVGKTWALEKQFIDIGFILDKKGIKHRRQVVLGERYGDTILELCNANNHAMVAVTTSQEDSVISSFQDKHNEQLVNHCLVPVLSVPIRA